MLGRGAFSSMAQCSWNGRRALGAALVYSALRPSANWRDYLFGWQPALVAALELGVFDVGRAAVTWSADRYDPLAPRARGRARRPEARARIAHR